MAYDFPSSPTDGQLFSPVTGPTWIYNAARGTWKRNAGTALPFNKIVNPTMQISQQNGNNISQVNQFYPADQWMFTFSLATGTPAIQRLAGASPRGSPYVLYLFTNSVAVPTLGAGEYVSIVHYIEGNRIADLQWGTASAKNAVLRFGVYASAGTYTVCLKNAASALCYACQFTITAPQAALPVEFSFVIPGPTTGSWPTDNNRSLELWFTYAAGSSKLAPSAFTWASGNFLAGPGQTNNMAGTGNYIELADVGLYVDPNNTGVAPQFQAPHVEDDLLDCLRYWYPGYRFDGVVNAATNAYAWCANYVMMRVAPSFSLVGTLRGHDVSVAPNITSISNYNTTPEASSLLFTMSAGGMTVGRPFHTLADGQTAGYIAVNARM